jgi:predicted nucleic acid-binding protein
MASSPAYLIDTNILVHYVRDDETGRLIRAKYDLLMTETTPAYCVVSEGEIRSLAYQWGWKSGKLDSMLFFLDYFRRQPIDTPEVLAAYAVIDAHSKRLGIKMGKNDLWIAAVAHVSDLHLLTTDEDFDHLDPVFLRRDLIKVG